MAGPMASSTTTFTYNLREATEQAIPSGPYWFVGSSFGRRNDQTERFVQEGIWEIDSPSEADSVLVNAMQAGQRIAIKAAFVQRHALPFENHGIDVSAMRIKATGTITATAGDGSRVSVQRKARRRRPALLDREDVSLGSS
jgi:hypothetical protein